ncbi:MAG: DUF1844 domain-containing protein [Fimbriimonadaceae bacterium]|nr:DUF1844 domain-containing protein [Fimbriimonadaceae bacterium]QYK58598.1 MAG: DUF1844 domain-containing protein [Fimbriimonadaceae bacterium]
MSDQEAKAPVDVFEFLAVVIDQTSALAWQKMGLQPDFVTGEIARDLDQAKVAVDATAALAALIEPRLDDEDRRRMQNLVRDLKINFVERTS